MKFTPDEMVKVQDYLRRTFGAPGIGIKPRAQAADSIEVLMNGEFIGIIYKNEEDGETSYDFNMSILDMDLDD